MISTTRSYLFVHCDCPDSVQNINYVEKDGMEYEDVTKKGCSNLEKYIMIIWRNILWSLDLDMKLLPNKQSRSFPAPTYLHMFK